MALAVLSAVSVADNKPGASATAETPAKLETMYDGSGAHDGEADAVAVPVPKDRRSFLGRSFLGRSSLGRAALAAGVFIAHPGITLAAQAPAAIEPSVLALVTTYYPLAIMIVAVLGALFGLWNARSKDDSPTNAGQVLSSAISSGVIAGAAAFTLIDLTKVAFLGASAAALTPLTASVATAALAQAAFSAKFTDPATTPADRIIGAFPAVAMAFGLGIGVMALTTPIGLLLALTASALMATGAATALYTALFRIEKSAVAGPAAMGRGAVLQSLMAGLAFVVGPSPYALFFLALSAWGFITVMKTTAQEAWSASAPLRARFTKKP
jgi:hypothetical protein